MHEQNRFDKHCCWTALSSSNRVIYLCRFHENQQTLCIFSFLNWAKWLTMPKLSHGSQCVLCVFLFLRWSGWSSLICSGSGAWNCCDPSGSDRPSPQWKAPRALGHIWDQRQTHRRRRPPDLRKLKTPSCFHSSSPANDPFTIPIPAHLYAATQWP